MVVVILVNDMNFNSPVLRENRLFSPLVPEKEDKPRFDRNFSDVDPKVLDVVGEWVLRERRVVTAKYLSRRCQISVNCAKSILGEFTRRHFRGGKIDVIQCRISSGYDCRRRTVCLLKLHNSMQSGDRSDVYAVAPRGVNCKRLHTAMRSAAKLENVLGPAIAAAPNKGKEFKMKNGDVGQQKITKALTKSKSGHPNVERRSKHKRQVI